MPFLFSRRPRPDAVAEAIKLAAAPSPSVLRTIDEVRSALPEDVVLDRTSPGFLAGVKFHWSGQAQSVIPAAIVKPTDVQQLCTVVQMLSAAHKADEPLVVAIRSGGHSPVKGFASAENGINVDMSNFNQVQLSDDQSVATIGTGARWSDVYKKLEPLGIAVAGGRAADVGAGGLTLGGGISFFSVGVGFVCDNVESFDVVLADGSLVTASESSNRDLLVALRGGGNNFGVVVSMRARTFLQGKMWTGTLYHNKSATADLIRAWHSFCDSKTYDKDAMGILVFGFSGKWQTCVPLSMIQCLKPVKCHPALKRFQDLKHFWSTMKIRTVSQAATDIGGFVQNGDRQFFWTTTFEHDLEAMEYAHAAYQESLQEVKGVRNIIWSLSFQPIFPAATINHANNAIGLDSAKTLIVTLISPKWDDAADDATILKAAQNLFGKIDTFSKERGLYHPFKYSNYCNARQKPYEGFGPGRLQMMREVSQKYDPQGFFQQSVKGGFKLW